MHLYLSINIQKINQSGMNNHQTQKKYTKSREIFVSDAYAHGRAMQDCLLEADLAFKAMLYLL